jgi:hypothetical protein
MIGITGGKNDKNRHGGRWGLGGKQLFLFASFVF